MNSNVKKIGLIVSVLLLLLVVAGFITKDQWLGWLGARSENDRKSSPTVVVNNQINDTVESKAVDQGVNTPTEEIQAVVENLEIPWEIAILNEGEWLVTERPGNLLRISQSGEAVTVSEIDGVVHVGEGGLLGLVLHPEFENNRWIYLYFTSQGETGLINRIERYTLTPDNSLIDKTTILSDIPGARFHDGGRMKFGPDGYLYVTTGDAGQEDMAQDTDTLHGKILRITDNGEPAEDNPFGNLVYSYGHRNPQGLAWDKDGNLWSSEHGPSGLQSGYDELNLIVKGGNYGWPVVRGEESQEGMIDPVIQSGSDTTWAPAGLAYAEGSLWMPGLRGKALYEISLDGTEVKEIEPRLQNEYGRLRTVQVVDSNMLLVLTSNLDGRGMAVSSDDRIIKVLINRL